MWKLGQQVIVTINGKVTEIKQLSTKVRYCIENKSGEMAFVDMENEKEGE